MPKLYDTSTRIPNYGHPSREVTHEELERLMKEGKVRKACGQYLTVQEGSVEDFKLQLQRLLEKFTANLAYYDNATHVEFEDETVTLSRTPYLYGEDINI